MRTQFITDGTGKKVSAILPIKEYEAMLEQLDELACIKAYDKAKAKKQPVFVPLKEAIQQLQEKEKR